MQLGSFDRRLCVARLSYQPTVNTRSVASCWLNGFTKLPVESIEHLHYGIHSSKSFYWSEWFPMRLGLGSKTNYIYAASRSWWEQSRIESYPFVQCCLGSYCVSCNSLYLLDLPNRLFENSSKLSALAGDAGLNNIRMGLSIA